MEARLHWEYVLHFNHRNLCSYLRLCLKLTRDSISRQYEGHHSIVRQTADTNIMVSAAWQTRGLVGPQVIALPDLSDRHCQ